MKSSIQKLTLLVMLATIGIIMGCKQDSDSPPASGSPQNITGFYYSFDETGPVIIDSSGNNFDGAPSSISRVTGHVGNAVQFLVLGSEIDLPIISEYFPFDTGFSFRAWVKTDAVITTRQQILGGLTGGASSTTVNNFGISLINDAISFDLAVEQNTFSVTTSQLSFPLDTWFHIAITYDGDLVSFYYNGVLVATDSILTTYDSYFQNQIGNNKRIFGGIQIEDQFLGYIDELYLENVIMTQEEIAAYYASTM